MKWCIPLLILIFLFIYIEAGNNGPEQKKAQNFTLPDTEGNNYQLYDSLNRGPIVINFWATWCIPCIEELKKMKKIYKKYNEDDVQFLAISIDDTKTVGRVKGFSKSNKYPFKILLDTNSEVMRLFGGIVPPYTLILDENGNVVYSHVGYKIGDEKKVEMELEKLLKQ
jgi:cytochrome c biogenesis protein CcmG/thiol:disulfide interchange protein DsbE